MDIKKELMLIKEVGHVEVLNRLYEEEIELNKKYYLVETLFFIEKMTSTLTFFKENDIVSISFIKKWKSDHNDDDYLWTDIDFLTSNGEKFKFKLQDFLSNLESSLRRLIRNEFIEENFENNIKINTPYSINLTEEGIKSLFHLLLNDELLATYNTNNLDLDLSTKKESSSLRKI